MKTLILIASLFIITTAHGQTVTKDTNGNYHASHKADTTANKATGRTFTDAKGKVYPVYVSSRGRLYYLRVSKAGNVYKSYLKID